MAREGLTLINGLNSELEFSTDKATWVEIRFTGDIEASGGEAPSNEVVTFKRVGQVVGHDRLPTLTVQVPSLIPHHSSWRSLTSANRDKTPLHFRIRTKEIKLDDSATGTAAIATTGAVTLSPVVEPASGNAHPIDWRTDMYGVGLGIKIGSSVYTVDSISDTGVLKVDPAPASAVAASTYTVVAPRLRLGSFLARATGLAAFALPAEGQLNKTLTLNPLVQLQDWVVEAA